eukprot:1390861-Amphidinium_carterae.1
MDWQFLLPSFAVQNTPENKPTNVSHSAVMDDFVNLPQSKGLKPNESSAGTGVEFCWGCYQFLVGVQEQCREQGAALQTHPAQSLDRCFDPCNLWNSVAPPVGVQRHSHSAVVSDGCVEHLSWARTEDGGGSHWALVVQSVEGSMRGAGTSCHVVLGRPSIARMLLCFY